MQTAGQPNDEVIVLPGTYDITQPGLSTKDGMNVHGEDGSSRPVINNTATIGIGVIGAGSTLRYVKVTATGAGGGGGGAAPDVQNGSTGEGGVARGPCAHQPHRWQTGGGGAATAPDRQ